MSISCGDTGEAACSIVSTGTFFQFQLRAPYISQNGPVLYGGDIPMPLDYCPDPGFFGPDGKVLSDSEVYGYLYMYLAQTFASLYCADAGFIPTGPALVTGYGETVLNFQGSLTG